MVEDLIITPFMKIGPAWARNRRKASVKIRRNPSRHQTDQVQSTEYFKTTNDRTSLYSCSNSLSNVLSLLEKNDNVKKRRKRKCSKCILSKSRKYKL